MKKLITIFAVIFMAAPAAADDNLLSKLGLVGLEIVSADAASQVSGRGFITSFGVSEATFDLDPFEDGSFTYDIFDDGELFARQDLTMEGIQQLEGLTGASNLLTVDFSQDGSAAPYFMYNGAITTLSTTWVGGDVD